jgi:AraC-like DNA-binding protein
MLSLRSLSDHTNISTNYISQVINQKTDSHFFDYINRFRIDAAKEQLAMKDEKTTVLDIAYNVGFNSKSTFNTAFKRHTDLTPTEYRKLYNLAV